MNLQELLSKQDLCISEEPSPCITKCPLHVDVKGIMEQISKGNFNKAYKILIKKQPFPKILSRICDHVCEKVCLREKLGGVISIHELEKSAVKYAIKDHPKSYPIPKNGNKIAVIGGGLSGLIAAVDLDKKGYSVTIYEKENKLGGRLWKFSKEILPDNIIEEEIDNLYKTSIEVKLNTEISEENISTFQEKYDAVYIGIGKKINIKLDMDTLQIGESGMFAGGIAANNNNSVIFSVSSGKRAAISIDRYVQKKSLTAARKNEGSYSTTLKLNTDDIPRVPAVNVLGEDGYNEQEAVEEAKRCIICQCVECSKSCNHLRKYNMMPKQYIRQINHNEAIILGDHYANEMINSCTLCGLCGEVCPSNLNMKDIILDTRRSMVARDKMPPSAHDFAIKDMEFSNSEKFALLKHQVGFEKSKYLFFPGCQLSASSPDYVEKVYRYLMNCTNEGVGVMLGCCGAPAEWAGREELFKSNIKNIKEKWNDMGNPIFILACSTCCNIFKNYAPKINFISLWEFMVKHGIPKNDKVKEKITFTIHDACTTRYNKELQNSVREIISSLGHDIEELKYSKEKTKCCGYGGLVYYANKEQADDIIKERIQESSRDYVVYCAMCRDLFASQGKRTLHLLDLIYGENLDELSKRKTPRLWQRRINRSILKSKLLKLFGENENNSKNLHLNIVLSESMKNLMENRWILLQDVESVIENAETSGEKFANPENTHYLAGKRLGNVTYWIEYEKNENCYVVYNAYSHRMEIMEEKNEG